MFQSIKDLLALAAVKGSIAEVMIQQEMETSGFSRKLIWEHMQRNLVVMKQSVKQGEQGVTSVTGLSGGDALRLANYRKANNPLSGDQMLAAVQSAIAVNEVNASMGLICATPTAGSSGTLAGALIAACDNLQLDEEEQVNFLFTAGAFGLVIANNASISGAAGGCQAEVGSAAAMASAALVSAAGGTPAMSAQALAITLQNMMGLICDPVAGLVEIPCISRNAAGVAQALVAADMALAGIQCIIPADEVIAAMYRVGRQMPAIFRETAEGGIADTPTAHKITDKLFH